MTEAIEQRVTRLEEKSKTLFECASRIKDKQEKHESEDGEAMKSIMEEIKCIRDDYANRLPIWATFLIATLTAALGGLLGNLIKGVTT